MSTNQAVLCNGRSLIALFGLLKFYIDARFHTVNARLDIIESQIRTLPEFMVNHAERIAAL